MEKYIGEKRPENEPTEKDRIFKSWRCRRWRRVEIARGCSKETEKLQISWFNSCSSDGKCEEEVRRRIQAGWMSWKKVSELVCDRKLSAKVKGAIRPAMLHGMETVVMTEKQVEKMEVAELKMVRWTLDVTKKDKIKNEYGM